MDDNSASYQLSAQPTALLTAAKPDASVAQVGQPNPGTPKADRPGGAISADDVWKAAISQLFLRLGTSLAGLTTAQAGSRIRIYGPNDAATVKQSPLSLQFLGRFRNPLIIILLIASALSAATGDVASFIIIASVVTLSIGLDFVQEVRAQNAVEALRRSVAVQATVRRDGGSASALRR